MIGGSVLVGRPLRYLQQRSDSFGSRCFSWFIYCTIYFCGPFLIAVLASFSPWLTGLDEWGMTTPFIVYLIPALAALFFFALGLNKFQK